MRGWKDGYMTKNAVTTEIKKVVAKSHGLNRLDVIVNWCSQWKEVRYPTGLIAKAGKIVLRAPGFATRTFWVSQERNQRWSMQ